MRNGLVCLLMMSTVVMYGCGGAESQVPPTDDPQATDTMAATQPSEGPATQSDAATTQPADESKAGGADFSENFDAMDLGELPESMPVLVGAFAVVEPPEALGRAGRVMMLPGQPLHQQDTGVLFGKNVKDGIAVTASFWAERTGRRYPRYGVGLSGANIYKLRVLAAARQLQLSKYDEVVASAPIDWADGSWVRIRLSLTRDGDTWQLTGKAWPAGDDEPAEPQVTWTDDEEPWPGQASVWATPFSGKPIYIDDITITSVD